MILIQLARYGDLLRHLLNRRFFETFWGGFLTVADDIDGNVLCKSPEFEPWPLELGCSSATYLKDQTIFIILRFSFVKQIRTLTV